jgi:hypothetical protein
VAYVKGYSQGEACKELARLFGIMAGEASPAIEAAPLPATKLQPVDTWQPLFPIPAGMMGTMPRTLYKHPGKLVQCWRYNDAAGLPLAFVGRFEPGKNGRDKDYYPLSVWVDNTSGKREWRWRNLPKPTIVQVQGKAIAGGLMLVWPFDLIVASDDAEFSDPVVAFGVNAHEFFVHVYEVGHRKAKEMLFTGDALGAAEAKALGMVNHVVPRAELEGFTLALAEKIAKRPSIGLKLAKMAANQSLDAQGMWSAVQAGFALHQIGHTHNLALHGIRVDPGGAQMIRDDAKASKAAKTPAE